MQSAETTAAFFHVKQHVISKHSEVDFQRITMEEVIQAIQKKDDIKDQILLLSIHSNSEAESASPKLRSKDAFDSSFLDP